MKEMSSKEVFAVSGGMELTFEGASLEENCAAFGILIGGIVGVILSKNDATDIALKSVLGGAAGGALGWGLGQVMETVVNGF